MIVRCIYKGLGCGQGSRRRCEFYLKIFLSISRDYFMIITIRARLVTASAGSFWGCFVIFTLCRLQPSSEIINKILFSSLITHYQRNKNKPAVGNVRLPSPASIRPQHFLREYLSEEFLFLNSSSDSAICLTSLSPCAQGAPAHHFLRHLHCFIQWI